MGQVRQQSSRQRIFLALNRELLPVVGPIYHLWLSLSIKLRDQGRAAPVLYPGLLAELLSTWRKHWQSRMSIHLTSSSVIRQLLSRRCFLLIETRRIPVDLF